MSLEHSGYNLSVKMRGARARFREKPDPKLRSAALRTAFVARFIVLREGRRTRAHRIIEEMCWTDNATAQELYERFRQAFMENGDKLQPVDRDLRRALAHAERSVDYFFDQYVGRSVLSFKDALADYERSNRLLFGENQDDLPRHGGWRLPSENTNGNGKA